MGKGTDFLEGYMLVVGVVDQNNRTDLRRRAIMCTIKQAVIEGHEIPEDTLYHLRAHARHARHMGLGVMEAAEHVRSYMWEYEMWFPEDATTPKKGNFDE